MTRPNRYVHVIWTHAKRDQPIDIYYEVSGSSVELRKVEIYACGRMDYADTQFGIGEAWISGVYFPEISEINAVPEFTAEIIDGLAFERVWQQAQQYHEIKISA